MVKGAGNVANERQADERLDVGAVAMRRKRIGEKDQRVDPAFGDQGADLLITAKRPAPNGFDQQLRAGFVDD